MALLVGAKLARYLQRTLDHVFVQIHLWSDNEVVIQWVWNDRSQIVFVQNRVAKIRALTSSVHIHHVNTKSNPADLLTRGIMPKELQSSPLWFSGPSWLTNEAEWPLQKANLVVALSLEVAGDNADRCRDSILPIKNISSYNKLISITKLVFKYIKIKVPNMTLLQPVQYWIREAQHEFYPEIFSILTFSNRNPPEGGVKIRMHFRSTLADKPA